MELLHAYSIDRIKKVAAVTAVNNGLTRIKGTPFDWRSTEGAGTALLIHPTLGFTISQNTAGLGIDLTPYLTGSSDPYWITVGWVSYCSTNRAAASAQDLIRLTNGAGGGSYVPVAANVAIFNSLPGYSNYVEFALNPVTNNYELYLNGNLIAQGGSSDLRFLNTTLYTSFSEINYSREFYVARFDNAERHYLRRWACETLVPATNNIGAGILLTDGTMSTVKETALAATYPIPAAALGVAVDVSAVSPDLTSALKIDFTDGTKSTSKTSSAFIRTLNTDGGSVGHAVSMGSLTPTKGATTLTVTATALDRA